MTGEDETRQDMTGEDETRQDMTGEDETRQDMTDEDETRQDMTGEDETRGDTAYSAGGNVTGEVKYRPKTAAFGISSATFDTANCGLIVALLILRRRVFGFFGF